MSIYYTSFVTFYKKNEKSPSFSNVILIFYIQVLYVYDHRTSDDVDLLEASR